MKDSKILTKLADGDMVAREACYHDLCMTNFTNQYRDYVTKKMNSNEQLETNHESIY